jgi:hypothetical protein
VVVVVGDPGPLVVVGRVVGGAGDGRVVLVGGVVVIGGGVGGVGLVGGGAVGGGPGRPGVTTPGTIRVAPTKLSRQMEATRTTSPVWGAWTIRPLPMYRPTWWMVAGSPGLSA